MRRNKENKIIKIQQIQIFPSKDQIKFIEDSINISRFVYNKCIEKIINDFKIDLTKKPTYEQKVDINIQEISNYITTYIRPNFKHIIKDTAAICLNPILESVKQSIHQYKFKRSKNINFREKNKFNSCSFERKDYKSLIYRIINNQPYIFCTRLGNCLLSTNLRWKAKYKFNTIRKVTIKKIGRKYYASIIFELEKNQIKQIKNSNRTLALDWGLKTYLNCWNGTNSFSFNIDNNIIYKYNKNIDFYQRKLSKSKIYSNNWFKYKNKLNELYFSKSSYIKNEINKIVNNIINNYNTFILEDLHFNKSDKYVKINRYINDKPYFLFKYILFNKIKYTINKKVYTIPPTYPSTQMCSNCGNVKLKEDKLTLKDRIYECKCCGFKEDRDLNAAKNIFNCRELTEFKI